MTETIERAAIAVFAAVAAAVVTAVISRTDILDRVFSKKRPSRLIGTKWESTWTQVSTTGSRERKEVFEFTHEKHGRVFGKVTMEEYPELKWQLEGVYDEKYLRLFWSHAPDSTNKFHVDSGCYFFERKGIGLLEGFAVGLSVESGKVEVAKHRLRQLPS